MGENAFFHVAPTKNITTNFEYCFELNAGPHTQNIGGKAGKNIINTKRDRVCVTHRGSPKICFLVWRFPHRIFGRIKGAHPLFGSFLNMQGMCVLAEVTTTIGTQRRNLLLISIESNGHRLQKL